jgi:hypothetical protein
MSTLYLCRSAPRMPGERNLSPASWRRRAGLRASRAALAHHPCLLPSSSRIARPAPRRHAAPAPRAVRFGRVRAAPLDRGDRAPGDFSGDARHARAEPPRVPSTSTLPRSRHWASPQPNLARFRPSAVAQPGQQRLVWDRRGVRPSARRRGTVKLYPLGHGRPSRSPASVPTGLGAATSRSRAPRNRPRAPAARARAGAAARSEDRRAPLDEAVAEPRPGAAAAPRGLEQPATVGAGPAELAGRTGL